MIFPSSALRLWVRDTALTPRADQRSAEPGTLWVHASGAHHSHCTSSVAGTAATLGIQSPEQFLCYSLQQHQRPMPRS